MAVPIRVADHDLLVLFDLSTGELDSYLDKVCSLCSTWFQSDGTTLFIKSPHGDRFILAAQSGVDRKIPTASSFGIGEGIAGAVAAEAVPRLLQGKLNENSMVESAIVTPLLTPQWECVGVLNLSRLSGSKPFTQNEADELMAISKGIGLAIQNACLITRLEATIEEYRALAAQSATIVNSLEIGILALDNLGKVRGFNPAAEKTFGKELMGISWEIAFQDLNDEDLRTLRHSVLDAYNSIPTTRSIRNNDRELRIHFGPMPDGGITMVIEDQTEHLALEKEFEKSRRLAEIGRMTAAIAHEIRNPLSGISGSAQLIETETSLSGAKEWAKVIRSEASELNDLCNEFLEFTREPLLNLENADLNWICKEAFERSESEFSDAKIIATFIPSAFTPLIEADPPKIRQAVRNLIRNSIEALGTQGEITVRVSVESNWAVVTVEDNGPGIADEKRESLFTPFFTTKSNGTGLGLCNVKRTVEAHGGKITLLSEPNLKTSFTLWFPLGEMN